MQILFWWLWSLSFNADFVLMIMIFVIYCSFCSDDYDLCYLPQRLFWWLWSLYLLQRLFWWLWSLSFTAAFILMIMIFVIYCSVCSDNYDLCIYCSFCSDDYDRGRSLQILFLITFHHLPQLLFWYDLQPWLKLSCWYNNRLYYSFRVGMTIAFTTDFVLVWPSPLLQISCWYDITFTTAFVLLWPSPLL